MADIFEKIKTSICTEVNVEGPINISEENYPFSSLKYSRAELDVSKYEFLEEEYFISGVANIYSNNAEDIEIFKEGVPYKNRILVRRPKDEKTASGRVFVDIMNATNGYDIEDLWRRSCNYIFENNHIYIGITSKPINVHSLKHFNYDRYKTLNWSNGELQCAPDIPDKHGNIRGCEEGLIWDMISQIGALIKSNSSRLFGESEIKNVYLTGQSQSGVYINTYANFFDKYLYLGNSALYDGYLSLVSGGMLKNLRQGINIAHPMNICEAFEAKMKVPYISINTEGDHNLFKPFGGLIRNTNSDEADNKRRYYEISGAPHTDSASVMVPLNTEIAKTKCPPRILDTEYDFRLNDFAFDYYVNGFLEKLHKWSTENIAPEICDLLQFENGEIVTDEHLNAVSGFRSPYLDVPKARYIASKEGSEVNGSMEFFDEDKMKELYGSFDNYLEEFKNCANKQLEKGDITENDYIRMCDWAKNVNS